MAVIELPGDRSGAASPRDRARLAPTWLIRHWIEAVAATSVLALSAGLNLVALDQEGFGNTYYAAAVWSMLQNWRAFVFASFDAGGFVTVDKPPIGLWLQALSAKVLGFNGVALLLPQALAGVAAVALVYYLVRRAFGPAAALVAALVLAVTPISVVTDRNNTMDATLVLSLVLAVWAVSVAAERGSLRALLVGAALVGVGFNIKMLQAYPVVPGLALAYLVCTPVGRWSKRIAHLALAGAVLLVVSLSWSVAVDLVPAVLRPYVGSSGSNSAISLALGYNGLSRITLAIAQQVPALSFLGQNIDLDVAPVLAPGIGNPGLLRLLNPSLAGQASWLLPLALIGLVGAGMAVTRPRPGDVSESDASGSMRRQRVSLVAWGGWLLTWGAIFSFARFYHLYYLIMLGPAVAALSGIGLVALWRLHRDSAAGWARWLLPAALLGSLWVELGVVNATPVGRPWLTPLLVVGTLAAVGLLVFEYVLQVRHVAVARTAAALGMSALLVAPLAWSVISVQNGNGGGWLVEAGPTVNGAFGGGGPGGLRGGGGRQAFPTGSGAQGFPSGSGTQGFPSGSGAQGFPSGSGTQGFPSGSGTQGFPNGGGAPGSPTGGGQAFGRGGQGFPAGAQGFPGGGGPQGFFGGGGAMTFAGPNWNRLDPALVSYLEANQGSAEYLVATQNSSYASLFILDTQQPAMALGGYQGWDRILTPDELSQLVRSGTVRFFYLPAPSGRQGGARFGSSSLDGTTDLVSWVGNNCAVVQPPGVQSSSGLQLYDCQGAASQVG